MQVTFEKKSVGKKKSTLPLEQRQSMRSRIVEGRERKQLQRSAIVGQTPVYTSSEEEYADWVFVAKVYGIDLPDKQVPLSCVFIEELLRKIHKSEKWYKEQTGFDELEDFITANPHWGALSFAGMMLEIVGKEKGIGRDD